MGNDSEPDRPDLRAIAETSAAEIETSEASNTLRWALRDLTANLLRIVRGAGSPYSIGQQVPALIAALTSYRDAVGHWPRAQDVTEMLSIDRNHEWRQDVPDSVLDRVDAKEQIVRGALQQAASRLVDQRMQERAGESEMHDGIRNLEAAREKGRKERKAAYAPTPPTRKPRLK